MARNGKNLNRSFRFRDAEQRTKFFEKLDGKVGNRWFNQVVDEFIDGKKRREIVDLELTLVGLKDAVQKHNEKVKKLLVELVKIDKWSDAIQFLREGYEKKEFFLEA